MNKEYLEMMIAGSLSYLGINGGMNHGAVLIHMLIGLFWYPRYLDIAIDLPDNSNMIAFLDAKSLAEQSGNLLDDIYPNHTNHRWFGYDTLPYLHHLSRDGSILVPKLPDSGGILNSYDNARVQFQKEFPIYVEKLESEWREQDNSNMPQELILAKAALVFMQDFRKSFVPR